MDWDIVQESEKMSSCMIAYQRIVSRGAHEDHCSSGATSGKTRWPTPVGWRT
jgi:hypothetical protein